MREAAYKALAQVGKERMHFRPPDEQNAHKVSCHNPGIPVWGCQMLAAESGHSEWCLAVLTRRGGTGTRKVMHAGCIWTGTGVGQSCHETLSGMPRGDVYGGLLPVAQLPQTSHSHSNIAECLR